MIAPAMTALALVLFAGQHASVALQAVSETETMETPVSGPIETGVDLNVELEQPRIPAIETDETSTIEPAPIVTTVAEPRDETETQVLPENAQPAALPETREPVIAQPAQFDVAARAQILGKAKTALAAAKTASGKFVQINADGSQSTGQFALRRPGKMRFDYDAPTPILIVADGTTVAMEDSELETVDRIPLASTPLGMLLDDDLDFTSDVDVLRVNQNQERISITVSDATGEMEGELMMLFDAASYDLLGWQTLDANLQLTKVDLLDVKTNTRIDPRLFRLDEAEDEEDER